MASPTRMPVRTSKMRASRCAAEASVEGPHGDEREGAGVDARVVKEELRRAAERAAEDAADDERWAEVARAAAAADGEARGDDLDGAEHGHELDAPPAEGEPFGAADRELRGAVAAPEDAEPLAGLAEVGPDEDDEGGREDAERQAAEPRFAPLRDAHLRGHALHGPQRRQERAREEGHDDREKRVERQVLGHERVAGRVREERAFA